MSKTNFKTASNFGVKALKENLAAGTESAKAESVKKSEVAASEKSKKSNRPQTAMPLASDAGSRKSLIQEAVARRSSHATIDNPV